MLTKVWEARWFIGQLVEGLTRPQGASPHSRLPHNLKLKHLSLSFRKIQWKDIYRWFSTGQVPEKQKNHATWWQWLMLLWPQVIYLWPLEGQSIYQLRWSIFGQRGSVWQRWLDHKDYGDTIVQQNRLIWWQEYNVIFIIIIIIRGFPYHAVNKLLSLRWEKI